MSYDYFYPLWISKESVMAHTRVHTRLVMLGGTVTAVLTVLWGLAYAAGTGGEVAVVPLVLGPLAGFIAALAATRLAGHPTGKATADTRPPGVPARSVR